MTNLVPNLFPKVPPGQCRLAVIGEAPGADEVIAREPFVGTSGRFLRAILGSTNVACDQLFFGNICQHNPPKNDIDSFDFSGPEISHGLERLREDLQTFRPNCLLLLGRTAFRAFRPDLCYQGKKDYVVPLSDWRGSIFKSVGQLGEYKCVSTYHPSFILRSYGDNPIFRFDVARAVFQARIPDLQTNRRDGILRPTFSQVIEYIGRYRCLRQLVTWDIEGYADSVGITMLSLCTSSTHGIVIPFYIEGKNYWSEDEEVKVWQALAELLADPLVPKCAHNAFYELFVSAWRHRLIINNLRDDTMMKHWESFPELERNLALCTSLYTEQPYYKGGRLSNDTDTKLQYNLTDSLVTHEVNEATQVRLATSPSSLEHYRFNINLIPAYNYIMLRGCKLDLEKVSQLSLSITNEIDTLSQEVDAAILSAASDAGVVTRKRKTDAFRFNVKSSQQKCWLLYDHLKYTPMKRWGRKADEEAILHYYHKHNDPLLRLILRTVRKRTRLSDLNKLFPDEDGRIRSSYDPVGTNTGRLSSRHSIALRLTSEGWENTGTNLQNVTKELRCCFIPDSEAYSFWQVDLSGADGWTVAADLAKAGFPTMLEDYFAGIKPALVLLHMLNEHEAKRDPSLVNRIQKNDLLPILKNIKNEINRLDGQTDSSGRPLDWKYLCCKCIQHGTNYGAQAKKISEIIFNESDGTVVLSEREAELYQRLYKSRYQTDNRNEGIRKKLCDNGFLLAACGIRRQFFKIRNRYDIDDATIREAASFEPQANTTWATNKALERLWYDESNRQSTGALHVEPLLQIHDALAGQNRTCDNEWSHGKLKEWFNNPLTIAGTRLNIPGEGKWGTNWMECKQSFL